MRHNYTDEELRTIGIYAIRNLETGRMYVGGTINRFVERISSHLRMLQKGRHYNKALQHDWDIYGVSCFEFRILQPVSDLTTREWGVLNSLELAHIRQAPAGVYNTERENRRLEMYS